MFQGRGFHPCPVTHGGPTMAKHGSVFTAAGRNKMLAADNDEHTYADGGKIT
jgi:hypothetical protein